MRVIVVEDNPDMGAYLGQGLSEQGFAVDIVANGKAGFEYASTGVYDLFSCSWLRKAPFGSHHVTVVAPSRTP
jgi:DNA-binding response OmpR family regulator